MLKHPIQVTPRAVTPQDFLDTPNGFPLAVVESTGGTSVYDSIKASLTKKPDGDEDFELKDLHWLIIEKGSGHTKKTVISDAQAKMLLFRILDLTFIRLKGVQKLNTGQAEFIDGMAKRYGVTPASIVWGSTHRTEMDDFVLNRAVANEGIKAENREIRKAKRK